jgi:predicted nucleotidyltransferase
MATITDEIIEIAEKFLELLKASNFRIEKAILFGSYVKGNATEWSDVDIAIISSDFSGIGFYDSKMLIPFLLKIDSRIEVHTFRPEEFNEENLFAREIIKNGVELRA